MKQSSKQERSSETLYKKNDHEGDKNVIYFVEKILKHKIETKRGKSKISFLIKWKDYEEPTWESETNMRQSINDDVETYLKNNKVVKKLKSKKGKVIFEKIIKCSKNHKDPSNFRQTINNWEVGDIECEGKCGVHFGMKKCGNKNPAWVCDGRIKHRCNIVYCTQCFCDKLLENNNRRGRKQRNNDYVQIASTKNSLRKTNKKNDSLEVAKL